VTPDHVSPGAGRYLARRRDDTHSLVARPLNCQPHEWCWKLPPPSPLPMQWIDAAALGPVRGIPTFPASLPMGSPFHRFPAAAQKDLSDEMWQMSTWGSGTYIRFDSNASELVVRFTLTLPYTEYEPLMPIDGSSGVDLYAYDTRRCAWLFVSNCLSAFEESQGNETVVCHLGSARGHNTTKFPRGVLSAHYMLYLPLYNGVSHLSIGYSGGVVLPGMGTALDMPGQPPVVWFGTSITQGGAASRPGAQFINGVTRSLSIPVINWVRRIGPSLQTTGVGWDGADTAGNRARRVLLGRGRWI
jgi:hypothetical protein